MYAPVPDSFHLLDLLFSYLLISPLFLVWIIGIIWALATWSRHPRTSVLTSLALGAFFLVYMGMEAFFFLLPGRLEESGLGSSADLLFRWFALFRNLMEACLWVLVLLAIFSGRKRPASPDG